MLELQLLPVLKFAEVRGVAVGSGIAFDDRVAAGTVVGVYNAGVGVTGDDAVMQVLALLEFACNVLLHVLELLRLLQGLKLLQVQTYRYCTVGAGNAGVSAGVEGARVASAAEVQKLQVHAGIAGVAAGAGIAGVAGGFPGARIADPRGGIAEL